MADHLYHWKHGWIPLDHHAALQKAKGNHAAALRMLGDAAHGGGIHNRADIAGAIKSMHEVPPADRPRAIADVVHAAEHHGVADTMVPPTYKTRGTREQLRRDLADAQRAQQLRAEAATGGYKTETNGYFGGKGAASSSVTESKLTQVSSDTEASRKAAADREEARAYRLEQQRRKAAGLVAEPPAEFHDAWAAQHNPFADHTPGHSTPASEATPAFGYHPPGHDPYQAAVDRALESLAAVAGTKREPAARAEFERAAAAQSAAEDARKPKNFKTATVNQLRDVVGSPASSVADRHAASIELRTRGGVDTPATAERQRVNDKARQIGDARRGTPGTYVNWTPAELNTAINSSSVPQDQRNAMRTALRTKVDAAKAATAPGIPHESIGRGAAQKAAQDKAAADKAASDARMAASAARINAQAHKPGGVVDQVRSGGAGDVTIKAEIARKSDPASYARTPAKTLLEKIDDPATPAPFKDAMRTALREKVDRAKKPAPAKEGRRVVTAPDGQTHAVPQGTRVYTHAGYYGPLSHEHGVPASRHGEYVFAGFSQTEEGARRLASSAAGTQHKQAEYYHGKGKVKKAPIHVRPTRLA